MGDRSPWRKACESIQINDPANLQVPPQFGTEKIVGVGSGSYLSDAVKALGERNVFLEWHAILNCDHNAPKSTYHDTGEWESRREGSPLTESLEMALLDLLLKISPIPTQASGQG